MACNRCYKYTNKDMKANELRLDNWIYVSNIGECQISGLDKINNDILLIVRNSEKEFKVTEKLICGIPLTEEWLLKCGFDKDGFNNIIYSLPKKNNFHLKIQFVKEYIYLRQSVSNDPTEDEMITIWNKDLAKRYMYVNELQNLYFALTGEELTVE